MLAVVAVWLAWVAGWLWRVELQRRAESSIDALGLASAREGVGLSITANGVVGGVPLVVRWRRGLLGVSVIVRFGAGGRWQRIPPDLDVEMWVRTQLGGMPVVE